MISTFERRKHTFSYRGLCAFIAVAFFLTSVVFPSTSYAQGVSLPMPGTMINMTPAFAPAIIKGVKIDPRQPFQFEFIIDTGRDHLQGDQLKDEANKLIKYFFAAVTVPDNELWVNLSPYEKDRIVPEEFGKTEMGRDLLAQDYILKQLTASLIYPEDNLGKKFWDRVYKKAYERYGTTNIPLNTFNKVWVIPDKAVVYEYQGTTAFIVDRHLKVMLEEDYLSLQNNIKNEKFGANLSSEAKTKDVNNVSSEIVREILIPEIEKEVNFGKNFANLRQIYNSMILSTWYKKRLKETILSGVYANQNKIAGVDIADKAASEKIYAQYLEAFKKGVYDFVKVDYDKNEKRNIPRKYFSGGCQHNSSAVEIKTDRSQLTVPEQVYGFKPGEGGSAGGDFVIVGGRTVPAIFDENKEQPIRKASVTSAVATGENVEKVESRPRTDVQNRKASFQDQAPLTPAEQKKMPDPKEGSFLEKGWVIANHILVSFHAAFITSLLSLSDNITDKGDVLSFVFTSPETLVSGLFMWITWHTGIAIHEMGHYLTALKVDALKSDILKDAKKAKEAADKNIFTRAAYYAKMFVLIPYGKFKGVTKSGLNYYADAPYNSRVKAAGPKISRVLGIAGLAVAVIGITAGLLSGVDSSIYVGRLALGLGAIGLLDFLMADPGEYKKYKAEEKEAKEKAAKVKEQESTSGDGWIDRVAAIKKRMVETRPWIARLGMRVIRAPWQYRNSGMGGRHTEKEYPESNISMQETMFVPLREVSYEEFQEMTVKLQDRLKKIIENAEGGRVMGIGLEGGLAPYIEKEKQDLVPEQRLWRMAKQAIEECGYIPGVDVGIALDPAASELENAYRAEKGEPDAVGMYLFWRSEDKVPMNRKEILALYETAMIRDNVPIVSIEDGFAEDDHDGWKLIMNKYGDKIFIIGDDSVTTRDSSIEEAADNGELNTFLVKANQIGTLSETIIALAVAIGKGVETVTSHRSKSPNDDMEAHIALAARSVGLKTGGGANTERLHKYGAVIKIMGETIQKAKKEAQQKVQEQGIEGDVSNVISKLEITSVVAREEATNAGIPTVGITISFGIPGSNVYEKLFTFDGATPLGTSAGTGEAIHLVDSVIDPAQVSKEEYLVLFKDAGDGSLRFKKEVTQGQVDQYNDVQFSELFRRSQRYGGKGCLNARDNVNDVLAKAFVGLKLSEVGSIEEIDRKLLTAETQMAINRKQIKNNAKSSDVIEIMQRKGNIGMNAILSQSLAAARLVATMQGKYLYEVIEEVLSKTMAKTIADNGGIAMLSKEAAEKINPQALELWEEMYYKLSFEELSEGLQEVNRTKPQDIKLYELVRSELDVYGEGVQTAIGSSALLTEKKVASSNVGGINLDSNKLNLEIRRDNTGIPLPVSQQPIMNMNIQGFKFNIMMIRPLTNLPMTLGLNDGQAPAFPMASL